jgi:hypothetical protein
MIELIPVVLIGLIFVVVILLATELGKQAAPQTLPVKKPRYQRVPKIPHKHNDWVRPALNIPVLPLSKADWKPPRNRPQPNPAPTPSKPNRSQPANPKQAELLSLLNGDRDTAQRLLSHCKQSNPGQPETWYFEKVISDILRDRR